MNPFREGHRMYDHAFELTDPTKCPTWRPDKGNKWHYVDMWVQKYMQYVEALEWCKEHCVELWTSRMMAFYFQSEAEATLFKLIHGEDRDVWVRADC